MADINEKKNRGKEMKKQIKEKPTTKYLHASSASTWSKCPGSLTIKRSPNPLADFSRADLGSAIHKLSEMVLKKEIKVDEINKTELPFEMRQAINEADPVFVLHCVEMYTEKIELDKKYEPISTKPKLEIEKKIVYKNLSGTIDAVMVAGNKITIYDLKTGQGEVLAENNMQLRIYGHLAALEYGVKNLEIIGVIVQPALNQILSAEFGYDPNFLDNLLAFVEANKTEFKTGPQCRYCAHNDICPTFRKQYTEFLQPEFGDETLDRAEIWAELLDVAKPMIEMLEKVQSNALAAAKLGVKIDGYEIALKNGKRSWQGNLDEDKIVGVLGLPAKLVFSTKLKTPAEIEKVFVKRKDRKELGDKLAGLVNQPQYASLKKVEKENKFDKNEFEVSVDISKKHMKKAGKKK